MTPKPLQATPNGTVLGDETAFLTMLPDELLLNIAERLTVPDLLQMSLVSKHIGAIAQEALYRYITLPYIQRLEARCRSPIAQLAETLVQRPELARKVRGLDLCPQMEEVSVDTKVAHMFSPWNEPPEQLQNFRMNMLEMQVAGKLLRMLINLKSLHITSMSGVCGTSASDLNPYAYVGNLAMRLFGPWSAKGDVSELLWLRRLEVLHIWGSSVDWAWCLLPRLKTLVLGHYCPLPSLGEFAKRSMIEDLELYLPTTLLLAADELHPNLPRFLGHLPKLTVLCIHLCDSQWDYHHNDVFPILSQNARGSFEALATALSPLAAMLEVLTISTCYHDVPNFFDHAFPLSTLAHFKCLRFLSIPHEAIAIDPTFQPPAPLRPLLPRNLQELHISWPYLSIVQSLEEIVLFPDSFPNLSTITLWPRDDRGDGYETFVYRRHRVWEELGKLDIAVNIFYDKADYRADWDDEDYDPFVINVVCWLERLWY